MSVKKEVGEDNEAGEERWRQLYFCGEIDGKCYCLSCGDELEEAKEESVREHYDNHHAGHKTKKRKADEDGVYQEEWKVLYFCGEVNGKPVCLVCKLEQEAEEDGIREHYKSCHALYYDKYVGELRKEKIYYFEYMLKLKEPVYENDCQVSDKANKAGYMLAREIAVALNPLTMGEVLKKCMFKAAGVICPEKQQEFGDINLSPHTITERVSELSEDVNYQLKNKVETFIALSVAIEKTKVNYTSPFAVFIRGVDEYLEVTEEFVELIPEMSSDDIFNSVVVALEKIGVDWTCVVSLATGREPSLLKEVTTKLKELLVKKYPNQEFLHLNCLVHQEMLSDILKISNVLEVFQHTVGLLKSQLPHQHRLLFRLDPRRKVTGSLLKDFYELRADVLEFVDVQELQDNVWLQDLAFILDMKEHLDDFKKQVDEQSKFVADFYYSICAFENKLELCERQLSEKSLIHFPTLKSLCHGKLLCHTQSIKYISSISKLREECQDAFSELKKLQEYFKVFQNPFTVNKDEVPNHLWPEIRKIKYDHTQKQKFFEVDIHSFYKSLGQQYFNLKSLASFVLSMFCTTSVCKRPISAEFLINSQHYATSQKSALRLAAAKSISPNFDELVKRRKLQNAETLGVIEEVDIKPILTSTRAGNSSNFGIPEIDLGSSDEESG
ncbi:general transcription factor II-I repeat domain-containing protein 2-like [Oratosquilla oratoria]|uniref:general transcription factor II-I repeat domain-containing protein 2-like n=1 Tax=Oratosquilla oratoria TaxID=337810 RepID=UPI003F773D14